MCKYLNKIIELNCTKTYPKQCTQNLRGKVKIIGEYYYYKIYEAETKVNRRSASAVACVTRSIIFV